MKPSETTTKRTERHTTARPFKVWRISRFRERWEMSGEYERKMGLEYLRLFIAAGGQKSTESTQFLAQLAELRHYYPKEYYHLRGVLDELSALTGTMERKYRGYLLNARLQPATLAELAARLDLPRAEMLKALKAIEKVGLIERVDLPVFADDPDEDCRKERDKQPDRTAKRGTSTRGRKAARACKTRRKCASSEDSETFPNSPEALYELTNDQTKKEILNGMAKGKAKGEGEGQAPTSPAATPPEGQGSKLKPQEITQGAGRHFPQSGGRQPAITPPPRVYRERRHFPQSEGRQPATAVADHTDGPRIVPLRRDGAAVPLGSLLPRAIDGLAHGYAVRAPDFATEIFALLGAPFAADERNGVREVANYRTALLDAIDAGLGPGQIEELMAKVRQDAARIGKHRKRYYANGGSPERYWRFLFNKHLNARRGLPAAGQKVGMI
jgi:hypothetical protein